MRSAPSSREQHRKPRLFFKMPFSNRHRRNSSISLHSIELQEVTHPVGEDSSTSPNRPPPQVETQDADSPLPSRSTRSVRSPWRNPFTTLIDFWSSSVSCELELSDCRDHLGRPFFEFALRCLSSMGITRVSRKPSRLRNILFNVC